MTKGKTRRLPTITESIIALLLVITVIIGGIRMKLGAPMSLLFGAVVSTAVAFYLHNKWEDIEEAMISTIRDGVVAMIIILVVGMTIGAWIIGGTVPALMYYGLKICTPTIMLPLTFILCSVTSIFTGTSFGSIATMGLALVGVATGLGMPVHIVAGAAVAGSYFGDKMSPLSDTTNMAPAMSGTTLYKHIGSELYSTVVPTIVCVVLYTVIGLRYANGDLDDSNIVIMTDTLSSTFKITPLALIPTLLVLVVSAMQVPAILGLTISLLVSIGFAMALQGESLVAVVNAAFVGYNAQTGVPLVDGLLSRGGAVGVQETVTLIICACMMGGALHKSGVLNVFVEQGLFKLIKKPAHLVVGTMVYCYSILLLSGNQLLGIIMGSRTFRDAYIKMDVHPKVLSRTLEDTNTIGAPLVPWSTAAAYITSVLGVSTAYIPYAFLGFLVPICALVCAFTGIGMWTADETPMWGKNKKAASLKKKAVSL